MTPFEKVILKMLRFFKKKQHKSKTVFLDPLSDDYFDNPKMTSIDVYAKSINSIPININLANNVVRVRLINCQLKKMPIGITKLVNVTNIELSENDFYDCVMRLEKKGFLKRKSDEFL